MPYLLGFGIPIAYIMMWTLTAKVLFRRYHLIEGEKRNCPWRTQVPPSQGRSRWDHDGDCVECRQINKQWFQSPNYRATSEGYSDQDLAGYSILQAFLWPVALLIYFMVTSVMVDPPRSPREVEAERARLQKRTRELERQLDAALEDSK